MLASAPTRESTAVSVIVTSRTLSVGRTRLKESKALSRVSEPPYMFSAITETRPSAEKTRMIPPKPLKTLSPASWSSAMPLPSNALAGPGRERGPDAHDPDGAEARAAVGPVERLADRHVRRQVAGVVGDVDRPADLVARHDRELHQERHQLEAAEVEGARRVVQREQDDGEDPEQQQEAVGQPLLHLVDQVVARDRGDRGHHRDDDDPELAAAVHGRVSSESAARMLLKTLKPAYCR